MKHIISTALAAGAQQICAEPAEPALPGIGSITLQPAFRPVFRRDVMAAVNTCARDLGIRQGAVVVLDALLSCLPCKGADGREAPVSPTTLLTVYASNETLCFRAKGLTERQLRRHLETLDRAGLIRRRDSANGKRFPVLRQGKPVGAFGLDLSPLFARSEDLVSLALRRRQEADELRGLKAQILRLRAACAGLQLSDPVAAFIDGLRNLVRRTTLTLTEARAALARLTAVLSTAETRPDTDGPHPEDSSDLPSAVPEPHPEPCPDTEGNRLSKPREQGESDAASAMKTRQTPASDGRYDRHKEQESDTKKTKPNAQRFARWSDLAEISAFYPEPAGPKQATDIAFEFGRMLRIRQDLLATAIHKLGLWELLKLEDRMAGQVGSIINPDGYMRSVLRC